MKNIVLRAVLALFVCAVAAVPAFAGEPVNVDGDGLAVKGYDPVGYFSDHKAVQGDAKFQSAYQGATYRFASAEHKSTFDKDPAKYAPQFGGYCAYAVAKGGTASIDPAAFQIVDGRLLLQYSTDIRDKFAQDAEGNLKKADGNWPGIVAKKGK